jgi:glutathione S-transferase
MILTIVLVGIVGLAWFLWEKSHRKTRPVPAGLQADIDLPHSQEFELYNNALSLCSMKTRVCLAELGIPYKSHPIDLIETGSYENIGRDFLAVNPGGTVPVLVHNGHPIYESHEQIRYAAQHAAPGSPQLVPDDPALREKMEYWIDCSSLTHDPIANTDKSAGNAAPGLTLPLFSAMIDRIGYMRILEGFLFHFDRKRPMLFLMLKFRGLERLHQMKPLIRMLARSRTDMGGHLDALEAQLTESGGPWILGETFSLADVSWLVIFERLVQTSSLHVFMGEGLRPASLAYWQRLQERPSFREAILECSHPTIAYGTDRLAKAKAADSTLRSALDGTG